MGIIIEMIKTGIILSLIIGFIYLIYWSIKRNIKFLIDRLGNKELIDWFIDGFKKGYTDEQLTEILAEKGYKINLIMKTLYKSKKLYKKEVTKNVKRRERNLQCIEKKA